MLAVKDRTKPILLKSPASADHTIRLRGLEEDGSPLILEVPAEGNFVQSMLDALARGLDDVRQLRATDTARIKLSKSTVTTRKLYHPASRVMHIALFEINCDDGVYFPRLDPRKYVEGCIVIRRATAVANAAGDATSSDHSVGRPWTRRKPPRPTPTPAKRIAGIRTATPT
ncbi:MAG: hypothetical protein R2873_20845 [Caldilineaceae bacterium]